MMKRDTFYTFHPIINFVYFSTVLLITMLQMHPVFIGIALISSCAYTIYLNGKRAIWFQLFGVIPLVIIMVLMNPLFNHAGVTVLAYMTNGNPVTLEAISYGIAAACMFAAVIMWFSCYNKVMTSDKFMYLFGKLIPALSLIISMSLRFVPRFKNQISHVANAQKNIGRDVTSGNVFKRLKCAFRILSVTITWALENAVCTADSMKGRGYGLRGRSAYSIYRFDNRDKLVLGMMLLCIAVFSACMLSGKIYFRLLPAIRQNSKNIYSAFGYIAYTVFCNTPIILNIKENLTWRVLKSGI